MGSIGAQEIFLILLIVLVFFGAKKLPELARGLGQGIREFRKAAKDVKEEVEKETSKLDEKDTNKLSEKDDTKPIG